jgi:hypothetical protein
MNPARYLGLFVLSFGSMIAGSVVTQKLLGERNAVFRVLASPRPSDTARNFKKSTAN